MKDSTLDYLACILFRVLSAVLGALPVGLVFFAGRRLGDLICLSDAKHRAQVRSNIRQALASRFSPREIRLITREFYQGLGQSIMEVFLIPVIDKKYINKYVAIEGLENIYDGFKKGKGVILMVVHEGSWELSNIVSSLQGFPFSVIVRDQGLKRLNAILNTYRRQKGAKTIDREFQLQTVVKVLKNNEAIAMTIDQGGVNGTHVKFFGKDASMATGAMRLALKYDSALLPVFFSRIKGAQAKIIIDPALNLKNTGDLTSDLQVNLQESIKVFEDFIGREPKEYLWTYKIWKHGLERDILILWDGRPGHLRQAQAAAASLTDILKERNIMARVETAEVHPVNKEAYLKLLKLKPDFIISCGSSTARLNYLLSKENRAKSVVIMRPGQFSTGKFDLVIMPRHDHPPHRPNIAVTEGALNLIDEDYLKEQAMKLKEGLRGKGQGLSLGLLIGGDSKKFRLKTETVAEVIRQIKKAAEDSGADILISTSRRTPPEIEDLIKNEFKDHSACKLLIIANEKNIPEAVGGILGLSSVIVISPESISMVSEAASSGRRTVVFKEKGLSRKHTVFLEYLSANNYISLTESLGLADKISQAQAHKSQLKILNDREKIKEAMGRII